MGITDLSTNPSLKKGSTAKVATNTPENPGHQQVGPPLVDTLVHSDFCGIAKKEFCWRAIVKTLMKTYLIVEAEK